MIRRVMQVEITPDEDDPTTCSVVVRNPRNGQVMLSISMEVTEEWLAEE